jgi:hypothetical protein
VSSLSVESRLDAGSDLIDAGLARLDLAFRRLARHGDLGNRLVLLAPLAQLLGRHRAALLVTGGRRRWRRIVIVHCDSNCDCREMSRVDTPALVVKEGWMEKKGKRRWFVLVGRTLYWFKQEPVREKLTDATANNDTHKQTNTPTNIPPQSTQSTPEIQKGKKKKKKKTYDFFSLSLSLFLSFCLSLFSRSRPQRASCEKSVKTTACSAPTRSVRLPTYTH